MNMWHGKRCHAEERGGEITVVSLYQLKGIVVNRVEWRTLIQSIAKSC